MAAAEQTAPPVAAAPKPQKLVGEWFWRFLAVVMLATVGWVLWIIYQINPQPLITRAGFEAAAKARASQGAKGKITVAVPAVERATQADAEKPPAQADAAKPAAEAKEPPVNAERLKFSNSIETPIPERGGQK